MKTIYLLILILIAAPFAYADEELYYPNGQIMMSNSETMTTTYFETGKVSTETPLKDNLPHGVVKTYYPSGKIMREVEYDNGSPAGKIREYDENGKLVQEINQESGAFKRYDENGEVAEEGQGDIPSDSLDVPLTGMK